jgi:hypothetical protein
VVLLLALALARPYFGPAQLKNKKKTRRPARLLGQRLPERRQRRQSTNKDEYGEMQEFAKRGLDLFAS